MKALITAVFLSLAVVPAFGDELAEGHWTSARLNSDKTAYEIYENWYEETAKGRVFHSKVLRTEPVPKVTPPPVVVPPAPTEKAPWYCYAHDFIDGHEVGDPKDDSCISSHYKASARTKNDAWRAAITVCQRNSRNPRTCEVYADRNCFPENQRYGGAL